MSAALKDVQHPRHRRPFRGLLALLLACGLVAVTAPSAFAHAAFLESTPKAGARLDRPPEQVRLQFSESLNQKLSRVTLRNLESGEAVAASVAPGGGRELVVSPRAALGTAAYRLEWHTVSTDDGHPLEGAFSFGIRTDVAAGSQQIEQSPLARAGWLRIALRGLFYAALLFFAGGVFNAVLLSRRQGPASWLIQESVEGSPSQSEGTRAAVGDRLWSRTIDAGWLAAGSAAATALVEAADAAGGFGLEGLGSFLLSNAAGLARVATVVALGLALTCVGRRTVLGAGLLAIALLSISVSGHANSAEPRLLAVATDWVHLLAGATWVGGIAQIAVSWRSLRAGPAKAGGVRAMRQVLERFGTVALPAFLIVVTSGLTNALIQLGEPAALWSSAYGRVLGVKVGLVGLIALVSYWHAMRLRPRLLAVGAVSGPGLERRHWRLLRSEPAIGVVVVVAAALLVAFPLPPRQLVEADEAEAALAAASACEPCPQRAPVRDELAVAESAGSSIAAVWVKRHQSGLRGELRLLDTNARPVKAEAEIPGASIESCGLGCWTFRVKGRPRLLAVRVPEGGKTYTARLPIRWDPGANERARRLLEKAQRTMRGLSSVRQHEQITSGPGTFAQTDYRLEAPDRLAYESGLGSGSVAIGKRRWTRAPGTPWTERELAGGLPFSTRRFFRWTSYARAVRLLRIERSNGRRIAELALVEEGTPVWVRLSVDLTTMRVTRSRLVTGGHFMTQRLFAHNRPVTIEAPSARPDAG